MQPPPEVLDLFAVPDHVTPLSGGQGHSFVAGDLVLSPGRDAATSAWLNPVLARLAVELDTATPRAIRIAMPIPSRDGRWVVDGWGASRYEPHSHHCRELDVLVATGRLLHAELASLVQTCPGLDHRDDRWARAERLAFAAEAGSVAGASPPGDPRRALLTRLERSFTGTDLGAEQLVHGDLAGNVLLDAAALPVVIDVAPYWRPVVWAEAVCVLDAALWHGAGARAVREWATDEARREAARRAGVFRILSDGVACQVDRYAVALASVLD